MKQFRLLLLILTLLTCCKENVDNYNKEYEIGVIPNSKEFITLNNNERVLDSTFNSYYKRIYILGDTNSSEHLSMERDFKNNRGRLLLTEIFNGKEKIQGEDKGEIKEISTFCECSIFKDTLFVNAGIGFFGGAGVLVKVYSKEFTSSFYEYMDDVKPYKVTINSAFTDNINVDSKNQYLLLDSMPTNKDGQQLTGILKMVSNEYLENRFGEKLDTKYVKVQLQFTCKTIQSNEHP